MEIKKLQKWVPKMGSPSIEGTYFYFRKIRQPSITRYNLKITNLCMLYFLYPVSFI